jgi:hypothetical protein
VACITTERALDTSWAGATSRRRRAVLPLRDPTAVGKFSSFTLEGVHQEFCKSREGDYSDAQRLRIWLSRSRCVAVCVFMVGVAMRSLTADRSHDLYFDMIQTNSTV